MKNQDAVSQFETSLMRATRRKGNDDQVREVASHYDDLYQEALNKGATIEEARKHADEHIGNVADIAKRIRAGNGKSSGFKLQWIAMALWFLGIFMPIVAEMNGYLVGSLWGRIIEAVQPLGLSMVYAGGFLAALGIFRANRVASLAFCLAMISIPTTHTCIILRHNWSFSKSDAGHKDHADYWHKYAVKYRPILTERYNLYVACISGSAQESDDAIRKLSATVKRPQDRGAVILEGEVGKWIYPLKDQKVRERNIRVFPLRANNLNYINFGATDSFVLARREWRSSNELLKAIPIFRKGSEVELARASLIPYDTVRAWISRASLGSAIPFLFSFLISLLMIGTAHATLKLLPRHRNAL